MQIDLKQIQIPSGGSVILTDIDWVHFEQLLDALGNGRTHRLSYTQGEVEIMSPLAVHEDNKEMIGDLVKVILEEYDIEFRSLGSVTLKKEKQTKAVEPDECFYIEHEAQVRGKRRIHLKNDPPPDLVIEIDIYSETKGGKLEIYEALEIPELWRFDGTKLFIYALKNKRYEKVKYSPHFPKLDLKQKIPACITQSIEEGRNKTMREFRAWVHQQ